ncbi:carbamoyltransferase [Corallincola platygyrae]|uniref:Carbamoyltransferase n=1 Tax=Corallincola platygyrae TaxID=1193278 RepID=A0ABW4XHZ9_9GAMM
MTRILGISALYHDSAAALVEDGRIIAAAQEERFTRRKHDPSFPAQAINYCLETAGCQLTDLDHIVFYDKPLLKFERLLETYMASAPRGFASFVRAMPIWLKEKLYLKSLLRRELSQLAGVSKQELPKLLFAEHHQSHAASAFFPSPFDKAAVLCLDGVGEWATSSAWLGEGNSLQPLWEISFPHSLGLLYSAFTYYCGFKVNSGEYKLMGLAPYGEPKYVDLIKEHLIDIKPDGSFRLDLSYFNYVTGSTMTSEKFHQLFGGAPRTEADELTQREMDLARSIQVVTEEVVLKLATSLKKETGADYLCLAGGVALNCVANGKLLEEKVFKQIWIQPAAGDAGGALGCALSALYQHCGVDRNTGTLDSQQGSYLGPDYNDEQIGEVLKTRGLPGELMEEDALFSKVADELASEHVVGWFQGRMEFGPRALGNRSILGDPRSREMQSVMNLKIKYRESFRPFAPSVLAEHVSDYFTMSDDSPYMLLVANVADAHRLPEGEDMPAFGIERLKYPRSLLPAITHVDYSARVQTVHKETNPRYHRLISEFSQRSDVPMVINTSFNVRGEPPVCSPDDAIDCFLGTEMDTLVLGNWRLEKSAMPEEAIAKAKQREFELD